MNNIGEKTLKAIEKARGKSERVRHIIALSIAGGFTFILFIVWIFVLLPVQMTSTEKVASSDNSPLVSLKAQVIGAWNDLKNSVPLNFNLQNDQR